MVTYTNTSYKTGLTYDKTYQELIKGYKNSLHYQDFQGASDDKLDELWINHMIWCSWIHNIWNVPKPRC